MHSVPAEQVSTPTHDFAMPQTDMALASHAVADRKWERARRRTSARRTLTTRSLWTTSHLPSPPCATWAPGCTGRSCRCAIPCMQRVFVLSVHAAAQDHAHKGTLHQPVMQVHNALRMNGCVSSLDPVWQHLACSTLPWRGRGAGMACALCHAGATPSARLSPCGNVEKCSACVLPQWLVNTCLCGMQDFLQWSLLARIVAKQVASRCTPSLRTSHSGMQHYWTLMAGQLTPNALVWWLRRSLENRCTSSLLLLFFMYLRKTNT